MTLANRLSDAIEHASFLDRFAGPALAGGARVGDCVDCPWHGSRFDLTTGSVTRGPATRPQPTYEVREREGRVEVRRLEERALRANLA